MGRAYGRAPCPLFTAGAREREVWEECVFLRTCGRVARLSATGAWSTPVRAMSAMVERETADQVWKSCPACDLGVPAEAFANPHYRPGTRTPCVFLVVNTKVYHPDSIVDGHITESRGREEVIRFSFRTSDDLVSLVVAELDKRGLIEYSSHPHYQPKGWYSYKDGFVLASPFGNYTGEREEASAHLFGFTGQEKMRVWERVHLL